MYVTEEKKKALIKNTCLLSFDNYGKSEVCVAWAWIELFGEFEETILGLLPQQGQVP